MISFWKCNFKASRQQRQCWLLCYSDFIRGDIFLSTDHQIHIMNRCLNKVVEICDLHQNVLAGNTSPGNFKRPLNAKVPKVETQRDLQSFLFLLYSFWYPEISGNDKHKFFFINCFIKVFFCYCNYLIGIFCNLALVLVNIKNVIFLTNEQLISTTIHPSTHW